METTRISNGSNFIIKVNGEVINRQISLKWEPSGMVSVFINGSHEEFLEWCSKTHEFFNISLWEHKNYDGPEWPDARYWNIKIDEIENAFLFNVVFIARYEQPIKIKLTFVRE
jgi:hypothetical protein